MRVLDVDGGTETPRVFGDIVAEDDGPHRRLAGARLALRTSALGRTGGKQCGADTHHQQNLLLAAFSFLHHGAWWWWVCGWYSRAGAGAGGLTGCGVVVVVWRGREGGGQRQAPMYTYVTRDLADMGCHSAAGRVARLVVLRTRWRWVLGSSPGASVLCPRTSLAAPWGPTAPRHTGRDRVCLRATS